MQTFGAFLVSFLAASGMAAALPAEGQQKTISVPVTYNANHAPHGPSALYKAKKKFGAPISENLKSNVAQHKAAKLARRQTGSAPNHPSDSEDDEYITNVSIGTPAQVLPLDFDTGSSDLWVFSSETPSSQAKGHTLFSPSKSSTAKKLSGYSWSISYGDGSSSSGDVYTDTVSVGGFSVTGQAVESATKVSSEFVSDTSNSGLLGLALDSLNTVSPKQQKTWFSNASSKLAQPVFTADLNHQANGSYNFGFIDTSLASGSISYVPISTANGFWEFTSASYAIGSGSTKKHSTDGIADTGTTLLLLDDTIVDAYYGQVSSAQYDNSQEGYTFDCDEDLPSFTFAVGSSKITVPGSLINFAPVSGNTCFGGLQSNDGIGISIFGDVAIKAALVVFDLGNKRLGWAQK